MMINSRYAALRHHHYSSWRRCGTIQRMDVLLSPHRFSHMQLTVKGLAGPVDAGRYPLYFRLSSFVTVSSLFPSSR